MHYKYNKYNITNGSIMGKATNTQQTRTFLSGDSSRSDESIEPSHATTPKEKEGWKENKSMEWNLVPLIGGRRLVIYNPPIRRKNTTYIPFIHCLLGDYISPIPPIKGTRNSYWTKGETKGYKAGTGMSCWYLVTGWFHPYISRL